MIKFLTIFINPDGRQRHYTSLKALILIEKRLGEISLPSNSTLYNFNRDQKAHFFGKDFTIRKNIAFGTGDVEPEPDLE